MIIYKATNKINGKCYIGQTTVGLKQRKSEHLWKRKKNSCSYFHNAINKYGEENFEWKIICKCNTKEELDEMEFHYIKQYHSFVTENGYNLTYGGEGCSGVKLTKEQRKKISVGNSGKKFTKEHKKKMSINKTEQWKDPLSTYNSDEYRQKLIDVTSGENNGMYGKTHSDETKLKMSESGKIHNAGEKNPMYGKTGKKCPHYDRDNSTKRWIVTLQDGEERVIYSLNKFARDYENETGIKLHVGNLTNVAKGNLKHYKKIKCRMELI